ncbi:oxygen-independent coproporphyrinogen III oxidase [Pedobacter sp. JY14-1]|uniref:oxygen-independent coproporphyrinogen III oxidase n=1 Tax=Pedobacter sp. JY14-1 TaxID=3034151 RepID=UPI0031FEEAFA
MAMDIDRLIEKYRIAAPRYTSYPTVPYWQDNEFSLPAYLDRLRGSFEENEKEVSLYIHLPFCESLCTYCGCNTRITKNHQVEEPYVAALLKEWALYKDALPALPIIKDLHLGGGTPTFFSPENLGRLINGLIGPSGLPDHANFSFEGHPANTTPEHLDKLYNLGFRRISLGIQDFDPVVQFAINRIQSYETVAAVTEAARKAGFTSLNYDLIYGLPHQQLEGLAKTIDMVCKLRPDRIAFYSYAHTPWLKPGQRRYTEKDLPSPAIKASLYELGRSKLLAAGYQEIGMDHFTLPGEHLHVAEKEGRLHRNFMGYTEQTGKVLIGLGVSSISDCWTGFAQNVKTVEAYHKALQADQLPIFKGHILDGEDLLLRRTILDLMCKGKAKWSDSERSTEAISQALERTEPLAEDGLVKVFQHAIAVTPLGKRFLRNICMCFDARLWAEKPAGQLFSMAD